MSITRDFRSYADEAQTRLVSVVGDATGVAGKAAGKAGEAAAKASEAAEKAAAKANGVAGKVQDGAQDLYQRAAALPLVTTITATVEPYVSQLTEKVESLYGELKKNDQVAKALHLAESAIDVVIGTVNERIVTPVRSAFEQEPAKASKVAPAETPAKVTAHVPAKTATRPAAKTTAKTTAARRSTAPRTTAKA